MANYDVIIIGGGVAGLNIAQLLGKYDISVCLVDAQEDILAMPFHTLGSFIDLKKFDLSKDCIVAKETECIFHSKHFHIKKTGKAYILNKSRLHQELLDRAISNNVEIKTSTDITSFTKDKNGRINSVVDTKGKGYRGNIFIDTSGTTGILSREVGLQDKKLKVAKGVEYNVKYLGPKYQCHLFIGKLYQGGYGWIFPLGQKRAILGICSLDEDVIDDLEEILDYMFKIDPIKKLVKKDNDKICCGVIPITEVKTKLVHKNLVCIGDSVSQVNPLVGEGYRSIMEAGLIASPYIYKAIKRDDHNILKGYEKKWQSKFYKDYRTCKLIQKIVVTANKNDILSDLFSLFFLTKRSKTLVRIFSGKITLRDLLLP